MLELRTIIIRCAIELISEYGFEQLTLEQVALKAGITRGLMLTQFNDVDVLIAFCLQKSLDKVIHFLSGLRASNFWKVESVKDFWNQMIEFDLNHPSPVGVIHRYLRSPITSLEVDIKGALMAAISPVFAGLKHRLNASNSQIHFVAFIHLFETAYKFTFPRPGTVRRVTKDIQEDYFYHHVETGLNKMLTMPLF